MSAVIAKPPKGESRLAFYYGDDRIDIQRLTRAANLSRIMIKVHPDCRVEVAAPEQANDEQVLAAVKQRARWIYQQLRDFRKQQEYVTPRQYVSGESHHYLGKQHLLKVIENPDAAQGVKLLRGRLEVTVRQRSGNKVRQLLADWYRARAKEVFSRRLESLQEQTLWVPERPPMRIQIMRTQWGSCSPSGRLILNPYLVKAPTECIDYVIMHELCHIAEHNHSERFYRLMRQVMPHWEQSKSRLDAMAIVILESDPSRSMASQGAEMLKPAISPVF